MQHFGQQALVVLHVRIDNGDIGRGARKRALDAGGSQAPPPDAMERAYARIAARDRMDRIPRAVRGVVVYEYRFPCDPLEHALEPLDHRRYVSVFVECGNDDRELRHAQFPYRRLRNGRLRHHERITRLHQWIDPVLD